MEHLEIEFKMLLKENIFKKILSDYKNQIKDSYQQTNYYLFHPLLEKKKYSLRIREKKGHYELSLIHIFFLEHSNLIEQLILHIFLILFQNSFFHL